jgi:hypothetical protein
VEDSPTSSDIFTSFYMALACLRATTPTPTCINLMARLAGVGEDTWKTVPHFMTNLKITNIRHGAA